MPASGKIVASDSTMPLPIAVPRCSWKRSIAAMTSSRLSVGACTTAAVPANDDDADLDVARQVGDERLGRLLRGDQAVRLDVGGAHAARDVHRQDDRLLRRRQRDQRRRARRGEQQRVSASSNSTGGTWRRQALRAPIASLTRPRLA